MDSWEVGRGVLVKGKSVQPLAMPLYIDSHCHMDGILQRLRYRSYEEFKAKARLPANYGGCVCVFSDPAAFSPSFSTWEELVKHDEVFGIFGMHPHHAKYYSPALEERIVACLEHPKAVAWGECGLDYAKNNSPPDVQRKVFTKQVTKAVEVMKPLVVHSRGAEDDTLAILKQNMPKEWRVHIHCFTDTPRQAKRLLGEFPNAYFGFTGLLTFPDSGRLRDAVKEIPLDRILLETDGPYMAPRNIEGKKSTVSHPGMVPHIAEQIALIKESSLESVYNAIRENMKKMYSI